MGAIPEEYDWVTPTMIAIGVVGSLIIVLCPRRAAAQEAFDAAEAHKPSEPEDAEPEPEPEPEPGPQPEGEPLSKRASP